MPAVTRVLVGAALAFLWCLTSIQAIDPEPLRAAGGLPPHVVGAFEEPAGFEQARDGTYYVFDRRRHAVHAVGPDRSSSRLLVDIGAEAGRIIQPSGFDVGADGRFVVTDVPRARARIQTFGPGGTRLGGFELPGQPAARVVIGDSMINGAGTVQLTERGLLLSHPESGALFTEYSHAGYPIASVGQLRATGFNADRDLHVAMNAGLPLVDPAGGYYYVFVTGRPAFRKYDARGVLVFERVIQGTEIDGLLARQPTTWPTRQILERQVPLVTPLIRAAAVNARGELWISLAVPVTYVFDPSGDKTRVVRFQGAGLLTPSSLSFAPDGRLLVTPGCYAFVVDAGQERPGHRAAG